jgi:ferredoxin-like protein FixX
VTNSQHQPIDYPKPDGVLSFDILTSVSRTNTNHAEDQPVHLHLEESARANHVKTNVEEYAGLLGRVCPAAVYEYVDAEGGEEDAVGKRLVINSQNCIHCKTCSIKVRFRFAPPFFLSPSFLTDLRPLSYPFLSRRYRRRTSAGVYRKAEEDPATSAPNLALFLLRSSRLPFPIVSPRLPSNVA